MDDELGHAQLQGVMTGWPWCCRNPGEAVRPDQE